MKINGKVISGPNTIEVFIPRGNDEVLTFKLQAVLSYDEFDKLCPAPQPPTKVHKSGNKSPDYTDIHYKQALIHYETQRSNYTFLKSISATVGLEFDEVKIEDPNTWQFLEKELTDAGLSQIERSRIYSGILEANCLNQEKIDEARNRFLRSREAHQNGSSSQWDERKSMELGELANVSISNHQG